MFGATNNNNDANNNIESKKKKNSNEVKTTDWKKFAIRFFTQFLTIICLGIVVFGTFGLYTAKVAQSNILPDNVNFAPYTNDAYKVKDPATIFMNIIKIRHLKGFNFWDNPINVYSQEAKFIDEDFSDSWIFKTICFLNKYANENKTFSSLSYFMHNILQTNLANSLGIVNTIYSFFYKLPEWIIMLFYLTVFPFILIFLLFYNGIRALITHLGNTGLAFASFEDGEFKDKGIFCGTDKNSGFFSSFYHAVKNICIFIFYVIMSFYLAFFMSFFTTIYSLFSPLLKKYKLNKSDETCGIGTFLIDTFVYKKSFILFLTAYTLLDSVSTYLNNSNYMIGCIIAILILAIGFNIFNPTDPTNDITQTIFTNKPGDISKIFKAKQVSTNVKIDCPIKSESVISNADVAAGATQNNPYIQPLFRSKNFAARVSPGGPVPETSSGPAGAQAAAGIPVNTSVPEIPPVPVPEPQFSQAPAPAPAPQFSQAPELQATAGPGIPVNTSGPGIQVNTSGSEPVNTSRIGGGKKYIPRKLNKDGTSHKKYDFKLA